MAPPIQLRYWCAASAARKRAVLINLNANTAHRRRLNAPSARERERPPGVLGQVPPCACAASQVHTLACHLTRCLLFAQPTTVASSPAWSTASPSSGDIASTSCPSWLRTRLWSACCSLCSFNYLTATQSTIAYILLEAWVTGYCCSTAPFDEAPGRMPAVGGAGADIKFRRLHMQRCIVL